MYTLSGMNPGFGPQYRTTKEEEEKRAPQEYDTEIMEASISQPYDFINMIAQGKDKKLVDFKKGEHTLTQEPRRSVSSSRKECCLQ